MTRSGAVFAKLCLGSPAFISGSTRQMQPSRVPWRRRVRKLLALLVALTIGCGVAASITITRMPATTDDNGAGYYFTEQVGRPPIL